MNKLLALRKAHHIDESVVTIFFVAPGDNSETCSIYGVKFCLIRILPGNRDQIKAILNT